MNTLYSAETNLQVVLGANGGAGRAIVRALAAQGKRVRAVSRSDRVDFPQEVERLSGDVTDKPFAQAACAGAAIVYHCVNVPYAKWPTQLPAIMDSVISAASRAQAKLIFVDNLYAYGKVSGALTESTPYRPIGRKGEVRVRLADQVLAAHRSGAIRAIIARASDFYGDGANSSMTELVLRPVLAGKNARWLGNLDAPHSLNYLDDFAKLVTLLAEREEALGEVWHIPCGEPLTGRQFIQFVFEAINAPPRFSVLPRWLMILVSPFMESAREELEELYQFEAPFSMDTGKFTRAFGEVALTPHRAAIRRTVEIYRQYKTGN